MKSRSMMRLVLPAAVIALAAPSPRLAVAQAPEEKPAGTFTEFLKQWATTEPRPNQPTPNPARETIDELQKARTRASGTPVPKPSPHDFSREPEP